MIRGATTDDLTAILEIGERFYNSTIHAELAPFSHEATEATLRHLIDHEDGILLVLDLDGIKGIAGALIYPFYMTGELTGQELFWRCEAKGQGLALLNALETEAKNKGAKSFNMISMDNMQPERLDKIYLAKGYNRAEHTYIKGLCHGG